MSSRSIKCTGTAIRFGNESLVSEASDRQKIEKILPVGRISDARRSIAQERLAKRHPVPVSEFTSAFAGMRAWPGLLAVRPHRE
jgi:hypothetical protein